VSSVGATSGKRTAYAAAMAAKARKQKIIAGVLGVLLIAILAYEVPKLLKLGGSKTPAAAAPAVAPRVVPSSAVILLKTLRRRPASDPFTQGIGTNDDPTSREVAAPPGSIDPFAPSSTSTQAGAPPPTATNSPLPEKIVIGTPGGNRKATHGWIVILASIPTGEGKPSASRFASTARSRGLNPVSVLNSSNRRPLRGGYWVVYTGPFATLSAVTNRAGSVHSTGYPTAYIRELIVYR
jgi:hypothetical protein